MKRYIPEVLIVEENEAIKRSLSLTIGSFAWIIFVEKNGGVVSKLEEYGPCDIIVLSYFNEMVLDVSEKFISSIENISPGSRIMMASSSEKEREEFFKKGFIVASKTSIAQVIKEIVV